MSQLSVLAFKHLHTRFQSPICSSSCPLAYVSTQLKARAPSNCQQPTYSFDIIDQGNYTHVQLIHCLGEYLSWWVSSHTSLGTAYPYLSKILTIFCVA